MTNPRVRFATLAAGVRTIHRSDGNLVRRWVDDTEVHVQLTTSVLVEMGHATFTGKNAADMAELVEMAWANA